jgi:taurine dioxygenase
MIEIRPSLSGFGAEILGASLANADQGVLDALRAAWRHHGVVVIRDQALAPEALLAFGRRLGSLDPAPNFDVRNSALAGHPEIAVVSNIKVGGEPIGGLGAGELAWHSDMTYVANPPAACVLAAQELPATGGDTLFLDLLAAWRDLPAELRQQAERARLLHETGYTSAGTKREGARPGEGSWHDLRGTDPVGGDPTLLLGRRLNTQVTFGEGAVGDGALLLQSLWAHADRPEYVYRHVWRQGDVLLWNNVRTMHRRDAFDPAGRRLLYRLQIRTLH